MIAISEGVPVIPAAIHGSQTWKLGNRPAVSIAFGEPMRFPDHPRNSKGYAAASEEIMAEIKRLWEWLVRIHELSRPRHATPPRREKSVVPLQAMRTCPRAAITRRQSPPSPSPRRPALASDECELWLGARDAELAGITGVAQ